MNEESAMIEGTGIIQAEASWVGNSYVDVNTS